MARDVGIKIQNLIGKVRTVFTVVIWLTAGLGAIAGLLTMLTGFASVYLTAISLAMGAMYIIISVISGLLAQLFLYLVCALVEGFGVMAEYFGMKIDVHDALQAEATDAEDIPEETAE